jgi:hypothetical protein
MDISTIKSKLEPPNGFIPKYNNYHEFIDDLRLVFSNAVTYNRMHETSDTTGLSEKILNAALHFQNKLECLINHDFSIDLTDKIIKDDIECAGKRKKMVTEYFHFYIYSLTCK